MSEARTGLMREDTPEAAAEREFRARVLGSSGGTDALMRALATGQANRDPNALLNPSIRFADEKPLDPSMVGRIQNPEVAAPFNPAGLQGRSPESFDATRGPPSADTRPGLPAIGPPAKSVAQRNIENNNPGNMKAPDGTYLSFPTREAGVAAIGDWLNRAQNIHGLTTLRQLVDDPVHGYAPSADPGNRGKMLPEAAARLVGVSPDEPIDVTNPIIKQKIVNAILTQEQGGAGVNGYHHSPEQTSGQAQLERVGNQTQRLLDQVIKEGGRSSETWERLGKAQEKMREYQERALNLAEHPPSATPTDSMQKLGGLATIVGILGGLLTKQPLTASLNAGAAAMEAYGKNDQEEYQRHLEQWKYHTNVLMKMADFEHDQYRDIIADERSESSERMNRIHTLASLLGNERMAAVAQIGDERSVRNHADSMAQSQRQFDMQMKRFDQAQERQDRQGWQVMTDPQSGKQFRYNAGTAEATDLSGNPIAAPETMQKTAGGGAGSQKVGKTETIEITDKDGKTSLMSVREGARPGEWYSSETGKLIELPEGAKVRVVPISQIGSRESVLLQRGLTSGADVRTDLKNLVELPWGSNRGVFSAYGSHGPTGMADAVKKNLANSITGEQAQAVNVAMVGIARALASLETGGVYVNQHLVDQYERLGPQEGDSGWTVLRKFASIRQNAENALEAALTNPRLSNQQKEYAQKLVDSLRESVPWSVSNVNDLQFKGGDTESIRDYAVHGKGLGGKGSLEVTKEQYEKLPPGSAYQVPGDSTVRYKQ